MVGGGRSELKDGLSWGAGEGAIATAVLMVGVALRSCSAKNGVLRDPNGNRSDFPKNRGGGAGPLGSDRMMTECRWMKRAAAGSGV